MLLVFQATFLPRATLGRYLDDGRHHTIRARIPAPPQGLAIMCETERLTSQGGLHGVRAIN